MARYRARQALFAVSRGYTLNERLAENRSELADFMFRRQIDPVFTIQSPPVKLLSHVNRRDEGLVKESIVDGIKGIEAVFASSRDIGTDVTEDMGTL